MLVSQKRNKIIKKRILYAIIKQGREPQLGWILGVNYALYGKVDEVNHWSIKNGDNIQNPNTTLVNLNHRYKKHDIYFYHSQNTPTHIQYTFIARAHNRNSMNNIKPNHIVIPIKTTCMITLLTYLIRRKNDMRE